MLPILASLTASNGSTHGCPLLHGMKKSRLPQLARRNQIFECCNGCAHRSLRVRGKSPAVAALAFMQIFPCCNGSMRSNTALWPPTSLVIPLVAATYPCLNGPACKLTATWYGAMSCTMQQQLEVTAIP